MLALATPFFKMCLLKLGPQDLPSSGLLLAVALTAYTLTAMLTSLAILPASSVVLAAFTDTALLSGLTVGLLYIHRFRSRLTQTLTALAGTGTVLGLAALPAAGWLVLSKESGGSIDQPRLILMALTLWGLIVMGHILRHALSTVFILGIVLAFIFYMVSANVMVVLFPVVL